jgi:hypothetical protein
MNKKIKNIISLVLSVLLTVFVIIPLGITPAVAATSPPEVSTSDASAISINSVVLNGNLISLGTATTVNVFFEYGTTINYGNSTSAVAKTNTSLFATKLNGISPGVTYHYRAKVDGGTNGTATGEDRAFRTATNPPVVSTSLATEVIANGAKFNGYLDSLGTATSANVYFEYGQTTAYGKSTNSTNKKETGAYSVTVTGLMPDTVYHFRAKADAGGQGTNAGVDFSFKTPVAVPPVVGTLSAKEVTNDAATLVGNVSALGSATSITVSFEYGTTTNYGIPSKNKKTISASDFSDPNVYHGGFEIDVEDLIPGTTYHFRAKGDGGINGIAYGEDFTFKTTGEQPITPPTVDTLAATDITTGSTTLNGDLVLMGTASIVDVYFEYGITTTYGTSTADKELSETGNFSIELTGLPSGTTYHFRAKADGGSNGVDLGPDMTFTTASISPTVDTSEATAITANTVALNGYLASTGTSSSVKVFFEYGITANYGITTSSQTLNGTGPFSINLPGLKTNTVYHFRAKADGGVNGTANGSDMTFTTLGPASISLAPDSVLDISPSGAVIGENVNISVTLSNAGGVSGTFAVVLKINGLIENSQDITVPAGATQVATFSIVKNITGTYQVDVNGLTGSFVVAADSVTTGTTTSQVPITTTPAKSSGNMQVLYIGVGAAIVVGLLIYLLMRRRA